MRMIDKKERSLLAELLEDQDQDVLGLLELIDLKGNAALDKAREIAQELELNKAAGRAGAIADPKPGLQADGRRSARTARAVDSQLRLDEFQETVDLLQAYGVDFHIDFEIVRGLDYYSGTVFEIYAQGLGAQRQICGGGTYELASLFGGKETFSTGFGLGFDRIMQIARIVGERAPPHLPHLLPGRQARCRKDRPLTAQVRSHSAGCHGQKHEGPAQGRLWSRGEVCCDRGQRGAGFRQAAPQRHVQWRAGGADAGGDRRAAWADGIWGTEEVTLTADHLRYHPIQIR